MGSRAELSRQSAAAPPSSATTSRRLMSTEGGWLASRQRPSERLRTTPRRSADKPADSTGQLTLGCKRPAPNKSPAMRAGSKRHSIRANEQRSGQSIGFHSGRLSTVKSGAYVCHQTDSRCRTGFYANRHIQDFCTELEELRPREARPDRSQTHQAMTMRTSPSAARAKRVKFTPEATEKIKELVAQGASREEIASLLGVTVGSLQVTCSRLGISLRRKILHSGPTPHLRRPKGTVIPAQGSVGVAYEQEQTAAEVLPARSAKISIIMRYRGEEVSTDLPLTSAIPGGPRANSFGRERRPQRSGRGCR